MLHSFCEFSSVIQLAATFNLGCIVLSGQKTFARSLANYFFRLEKYMNSVFGEIMDQTLTDKNSFDNMLPQTIQGHDYRIEIDSLRDKFENLEKRTNHVLNMVNQEIDTNYVPKYLDSICIVLGLYSLFELIISVFIKMSEENHMLTFSALNIMILLVVLVCMIGEAVYYCSFFIRKKEPQIWNFFAQGKNAVLVSVVSFFLAWIFPYANRLFCPLIAYSEDIECFHFYVGLLLPFAGFLVYWVYIQILSEKAKILIEENFTPLKDEFRELHERRNEIDTILTEFSINNIQFEDNN